MSDKTKRPDRMLTPKQVAEEFGVDSKSVTRWAKAGLLTAIRTLGGPTGPGHRRYRESDIRALLEKQTDHATQPEVAG